MYTVIIPSLGRINYLNELLQSIYKQTLLPEEIIILLDQNKICKDIDKLINKKNICKVIFCKFLTTPQKRNYGVQISKTSYIIFSDDDDIWEINKASLTLDSLENYQVVAHSFSKFGNKFKEFNSLLGHKKKLIDIKYLLYADNIFGGGSGIAARKEILQAIPFNDDLYSEDYDWWIKIILSGIKIEYLPYSLVKYRTHKNNMTSNFLKIYFFNLKIFKDLIIKSFILFFASVIGFLKSTIKAFILLLLCFSFSKFQQKQKIKKNEK